MSIRTKRWIGCVLVIALLLGSRSIYLNAMEGDKANPAVSAANEQASSVEHEAIEPVQSTAPAAPSGQVTATVADVRAASTEGNEQVQIPELTDALVGMKMAENDRFELFVDEKTANVRIVDKQTKREWHGAPPMDKKTPPNNIKFVQAPVHLKYTTGTELSQTYSLQDAENTTAVEAIEGGARATFTFANHGITLSVEYRLTEQGLTVRIPYESILEQGPSRLVSVEVLPFFQAASPWQQGAVFVPDGSGALMRIKAQRAQSFNAYSEFIYGSDPVFLKHSHTQLLPSWRQTVFSKEQIALPVYGIYADGSGFLGIVSQGDHDAKINATPAGIRNIQLYRASAEFIYRNDDIIFIGDNPSEIPLYQGRMIGGDRMLELILLQGEDAHYVGMAKAYREYLIARQGLAPVVHADIPLQIRIFAGVLRYEVLGKTFISMTTFEQVKHIIDAYKARGIDNLEITIEGWSKGGVYGTQPKHFPVESALGGQRGLKELADYASSQGVRLYLKANYVRPFEEEGDFRKNRDAVYGIKKEPQESYNYWLDTRWNDPDELFYLLKPDRVYNNHIAKEIERYKELGIDGVHLQYMGDTLYSDQDPKHPSTREETKKVWIQVMDELRAATGRTAVDYGNAYVLGHVDRIDDIPVDSSHFTYLDEAVPFLQIVLHGYVPYTAEPTNLEDDPRVEFLRKLETGAWPSYELTYEPTSNLQRTMKTDLISSEFANWLEPSIEEYTRIADLYAKIYDQPITGHEILSKWVRRTTYANGISVMVNYHSKPQTADGYTLEPYGYLVLEGGR